MNLFKNAALLLAGATMMTNIAKAQNSAPTPDNISNRTTQTINFQQNKETSILKINPEYMQKLRAFLPLEDTTKFYLSSRETHAKYATPTQDKDNTSKEDINMVDHATLIRDGVDFATKWITFVDAEDEKNSYDKIFAIQFQQAYSQGKDGKIGPHDLAGIDPEEDGNKIIVYINKENGLREVIVSDAGLKVVDFDFKDNLKEKNRILAGILSGKKDPIESYQVNKGIKFNSTVVLNDMLSDSELDSHKGPLSGTDVINFKNKTGYNL